MDTTRSGENTSVQIARMGVIDATDANFKLVNGASFNINNEGQPVQMKIRLSGMPEGEFVTTRIETGWNPEIVKEVKQTSVPHDLKWGY